MEFRLTYEGPLKANGSPKDKQHIRRIIHKQLQILWQQEPLNQFLCPKSQWLADNPEQGHISIIRPVGSFKFAPLICPAIKLIAELSIIFLRPEPPGFLVTQGGDIDNRIKTLLDALRMPKNLSELPNGTTPAVDELPFFCLLEDDNLVTKLSISTDRFLKDTIDASHVLLIIHVKTKVTTGTLANLGLG